MGARTPGELEVDSVLEREGTVKIGEHSPITAGASIGARIPAGYARPLGLFEAEKVETFVNFELGCALVRIPRPSENELEE